MVRLCKRSLSNIYDYKAIIFVIDSSDKLRLNLVKRELDILFELKDIEKAPIIFLANKMDIVGSLAPIEIAESMKLSALKRSWNIMYFIY